MKPLFCLPWGYLIGQLLLASNVLAEPPPQTPFTQSETTTIETLTETARRWGLSVEEYHRYTEIMRGPLGRWNPEMDPVMALGILTENEQERQRYAEYFAQREYALTVKTLAFERAYRAAFRRLFPEAEIIDTQALQPFYNHQQQHRQKQQQEKVKAFLTEAPHLQAGDRLLYFPDLNCQDCGKLVHWLFDRLLTTTDTGLDIYVRQSTTEEQVRQWAIDQAITLDWLQGGKVTLNRDQGLFKRLRENTPRSKNTDSGISTLFLSRHDQLFTVPTASLRF